MKKKSSKFSGKKSSSKKKPSKKNSPRSRAAQHKLAQFAKRSKAAKLGAKRRKATAALKAKARTGKKISKALKRYHRTGLTKQEQKQKARAGGTVLIQAPDYEEIPAFQVKDQVEADAGLLDTLERGLAQLAPGVVVTATFSVAAFAADGTKAPDKIVTVPVVVSDPLSTEQFWRDFYHDVRDELEDELYGEDGAGGGSAVTLSSVVG